MINYAEAVLELRVKFNLLQTELVNILGVAFTSVCRRKQIKKIIGKC